MNIPALDLAAAHQLVEDCLATATDARKVLHEAEERLAAAQLQRSAAAIFDQTAKNADTKVLALIGEYRTAQRAKLLETLGDNPVDWQGQDLTKFVAQPLRNWLEGKTVINAETLSNLLGSFRAVTGEGFPKELRGKDHLQVFAELLISRMYVDDDWPRLCVVDNGGLIIKDVSIQFEARELR